jgi:hypothetical protein
VEAYTFECNDITGFSILGFVNDPIGSYIAVDGLYGQREVNVCALRLGVGTRFTFSKFFYFLRPIDSKMQWDKSDSARGKRIRSYSKVE